MFILDSRPVFSMPVLLSVDAVCFPRLVKIIMDKRLVEAEWASFHPMDNTGSTAINKEGIMKLKELGGRDDS